MSGSRTALVCGLCGVAALAASTLAGRMPGAAAPSAPKALAAALIALVLAVGVLSRAVGPWQRLTELPFSREGLSLAWTRGPYGAIAGDMMRAYPLTGVGVGSYHVLAPDYWRVEADNALPFDNAQNWWRHQAAELGLLGALPLFAWSALAAWRVLTGRVQFDPAAGFVARGLLVGLGVISLLGMPTQNPLVLLWFFFLIAWMAALVGERPLDRTEGPRWMGVAAAGLMLSAIGYAGGHVLLARGSLGVVERAKQSQRDFVSGAYETEPRGDGGEFRWTGRESRFVWVARTRWLVVRVWAAHPDLALNPVRVTVSTPCQTVFAEDLRSTQPISLGLQLPEELPFLETSVRVSRTWRPSAFGEDDPRELGAGISTGFETTREGTLSQDRVVEVADCRP